MKPPLIQLIEKLDEEGRLVFQGTLLLGYTPRQALYNGFGWGTDLGTEVDTTPWGIFMVYDHVNDQRLCELVMNVPKEQIEAAFWQTVENEIF